MKSRSECYGCDFEPFCVAVYRNPGRSVLIVRQKDGSIRAFANSCLRRGRELCTETLQHRTELKCPYHGFTWSIDGALKWIPCQWDLPQVKAETHKLAEVRCEQWNGFVFINFDQNAPTLRDDMGKMVEQWESVEGWNFHNRFRAASVIRPMAVNWKVCMEAFIEVLHAFESHTHTRPGDSDVQTQYDIWPDEQLFSRMPTPMGIPSPHPKYGRNWLNVRAVPNRLQTRRSANWRQATSKKHCTSSRWRCSSHPTASPSAR